MKIKDAPPIMAKNRLFILHVAEDVEQMEFPFTTDGQPLWRVAW